MEVVAFDLSLTAIGFASEHRSECIRPPATLRGVARLRWVRNEVLKRVPANALVVLEGYSFASRGRAIVSLGELGGVIRMALADAAVMWVDVPPACRAKYAAGKGTASKEAVLAAAIRRLGYEGHDHNECDALWLRAMALDALGLPGAPTLPAAHRAALNSIAWPSLRKAA